MKTRNGFVSNSSSSSYIVVLPDNFKLETDIPNLHIAFDFFKKEGCFNAKYSIIKGLDKEKGNVADCLHDLRNMLGAYIVEVLDGGPDEGNNLILIANDKIRRVWNENT